MSKKKWTKSTVKFKVGRKPIEFQVIHNLADQGYTIGGPLLDNWLARTKTYDDRSLVDYINSKTHMTGCFALTLEDYEKAISTPKN